MSEPAATLTLTLVNETSEIERACTAAERFIEEQQISPEIAYAFSLTLDEVIANVIRHGITDSSRHEIRVHLWIDDDVLVMQIEDDGQAFNPLLAPAPDLDLPIEQRPIGGLGIHIMRTMMDDLEYERTDGFNILTLRKRVGRVDPGMLA
jgi:anti-sigma regulatory factor (Ser/Thr protein kinase)